ncbi:MAG: tetratricopeptide repeat protein [Acidobacteriota bacterium]|nr:tetratricopeptide repeat protein [Acidobacteriota bacterium]
MDTNLFSAAKFGVDVVLKVTLLVSLVLLLIGGLRRLSASSRHLLAMLGLAGALALPFVGLIAPSVAIPLVPSLLPARPAETVALPSLEPEPVSKASLEAREGNAPSDGLEVTASEELRPAHATVSSAPPPAPRSSFLSRLAPSTIVKIALLAWALGAGISLTRLAAGWRRLRLIAQRAETVSDPDWTSTARDLARRLGISRAVRLLSSREVPVAMTAGIRNPMLLVHEGARKWQPERRRVVLLHELAHVRRADWLTLLLAEIAAAIYWFHPLVWLARREARRSCERACDDLVLDNGTKPSVYAAHLLGIVRSLKPARARALPVMAMARPSQFEGRMRAILDPGLHRRGPSPATTRGAALGALFAVVSLGALQPWQEKTPGSAGARTPTIEAVSGGSAASGEDEAPALLPAAARREAASAPATAGDKIGDKARDKDCPAKRAAEAAAPDAAGSPKPDFAPAVIQSTPSPSAAPAPGFVLASNGRTRSGSDWYSKGMDLHHDERYDEAIAAFEKAIELGHREDAASYNIACGYALKGDANRAFEWLKKAEEAGFSLENYLSSDDDLDSLKSDPRWSAFRKESRAKHFSEHKEKAAGAAKRYERVAARPAADGSAFYDSGRELLKTGEYELAAKAFLRSAELGNRPGTSYYNAACAFSLGGQAPQALEHLRMALDNGFDDAKLMRTDDDLDAVRSDSRFKEILTLAEDLKMPSVEWSAGFLRSTRRSEWRDAVKQAEKATAKSPRMGRAWFNLGFTQIRAERPDAAAESFQKALELGYRKPTTMYNLACSFAMLDRKDQAFDWLFKSLDAGFRSDSMLRSDEDLDNLRGDPRFRKALEIAKAKSEKDQD